MFVAVPCGFDLKLRGEEGLGGVVFIKSNNPNLGDG